VTDCGKVRTRFRRGCEGSTARSIVERCEGLLAHPSRDLLASLKRDPSLRLNESGRVMLRLFEAHALDEVAWERLIASVPNHCTPTMVDAAQQCMDTWRRFAERLRARPAD
jgi:hypothetical protein